MTASALRCALLVASATATLSAGCALDSDAQEGDGMQLVSAAQLSSAPAGSPERTVLRWWRSLQRREAVGVLRPLSPAARRPLVGQRSGPALVENVGRTMAFVAPRILEVERRAGSRATVYLELQRNLPLGEGVAVEREEFLALPLRRLSGSWRIDDSAWLRASAGVTYEAEPRGPVVNRRRFAAIRSCLNETGLTPARTKAPEGASQLTVTIGLTNSAFVYIFESPAAAAAERESLTAFVLGGGGEARPFGDTIVGYPKPPTKRQATLVERCV